MIDKKIIKETNDLLVKLIQNKCVNPPGNEIRNIKTIEQFLSEKGIGSQIFKTADNRANLLARIKGTGDGPTLMFGPAHVDVVPVPNPEDWKVDPFSGKIIDGKIYGRGSMDMLFIVCCQVQAFAQLHNEEFKPKGDIILFIVSDEEAGGVFGAKWMFENHPDLIKTDYAVSEMGGSTVSDGKIILMIGEKGSAWKKLRFKGTPGHGSMPFGSDNAVEKAAKAISRIRDYCDNKTPLTTKYLTYVAEGMAMSSLQKFMLTKRFLLPFTLKMLKKKDPNMAKVIHSLSRMTMSPNMVMGGVKPNLIAANAEIKIDIRTLPGQDNEYVIKHIKKALGDLDNESEIMQIPPEEGGIFSEGNASEPTSDFVSAMKRAVNLEFPGSKFVPFLMPAMSDLRFFREKGTKAYGFSLLDPKTSTADISSLPHGRNECISLKTVELSLKAYYNLPKEFLG